MSSNGQSPMAMFNIAEMTVIVKPLFLADIIGIKRRNAFPEPVRMIHDIEMTQLMQNHIILH